MRGLDLNAFDFDYDLTWFAFMLTPDGGVLGRFGGRDTATPGKFHSLKALRLSLEHALTRFRAGTVPPASKAAARRAEDYPASKILTAKACIHCHHVYEFRREQMLDAGTWKLDQLWVYPQPDNIGLSIVIDQGNVIAGVKQGSVADRAGLEVGDQLRLVNGMPIASIADLQYALHRSPWQGKVLVVWKRNGQEMDATIEVPTGWKHTDLSWRWSIKSMSPSPGLQGYDLSIDEKKALGLAPAALAFRQMSFLSPEARHAGVMVNDIILGVNKQYPSMTAQQFETFMRLTYKTGDTVTLHVLRGKQRLDLAMKLGK